MQKNHLKRLLCCLFAAAVSGSSLPVTATATQELQSLSVAEEEEQPEPAQTDITSTETTTSSTTEATTTFTQLTTTESETTAEMTTETTATTATSTESQTTTTTTTTTTESTTTTETTTTTTETTTTTTMPDPQPTLLFEGGYPDGITMMHLVIEHNPGVCAVGFSVQLPEILSGYANAERKIVFHPGAALGEGSIAAYYNAETHTFSFAYAADQPGEPVDDLGWAVLSVNSSAVIGQEYPVTFTVSSLATAGEQYRWNLSGETVFTPAEPPERTLSETELNIQTLGETAQLALSPAPPAGSFTWASSAPEIVSVTETGLITALQEGSAEISVTCQGKTYVCYVTVQLERTLEPASFTATKQGETVQLSISPELPTAYTWESSDPDILSIDSNGLATAYRNGTVSVIVRCGTLEYEFPFTVTIPRALNFTEYTFENAADRLALSLEPAPLDAVQFTADHTEIISVTEDGKVTPLKNGTATVSAVSEGITYVCTVNVSLPYYLNMTEYAATAAGEQCKLVLINWDTEAAPLTWKSSDEAVATVDADGTVTILMGGEADITVEADGVEYQCHVLYLPYLRGDVNLNGTIETEDAQLCLEYYVNLQAGLPGGLSALARLAADVDENGAIESGDAQLILEYVVNHTIGIDVTWEELIQPKEES